MGNEDLLIYFVSWSHTHLLLFRRNAIIYLKNVKMLAVSFDWLNIFPCFTLKLSGFLQVNFINHTLHYRYVEVHSKSCPTVCLSYIRSAIGSSFKWWQGESKSDLLPLNALGCFF